MNFKLSKSPDDLSPSPIRAYARHGLLWRTFRRIRHFFSRRGIVRIRWGP